MEYARRRTSCAEPDVVLAESRNACAARGESALIGQGRGHVFDHDRIPGHAVRGGDQRELAVQRIAHGDSVRAVPESKAIIKSLGIAVGELPLPDSAAVGGLIDTRLIARANAQDKGGILVESLDIAKVERIGVHDSQCLPGLAAVNGPQNRAFSPAGPGYLAGNGADAAKRDVGFAVLRLLRVNHRRK